MNLGGNGRNTSVFVVFLLSNESLIRYKVFASIGTIFDQIIHSAVEIAQLRAIVLALDSVIIDVVAN